ncbi:MAG: hypothetical protein Kow0037_10990 [Calditrichia bacterium]
MDAAAKIQFLKRKPVQFLFWLFSLFFLNALFFLPEVLLSPEHFPFFPIPPANLPRGWYDQILFFLRRENVDLFRLCADFYLILLTAYFTVKRKSFSRIIKLLFVLYVFLLIFHAYTLSMFFVYGKHPVLYNDLRLLLGGFYLIVDLSFSRLAGVVFAVAAGAIALFFLLPKIFNYALSGLRKYLTTKIALILNGGVLLLLLLLTGWFGFFNKKMEIRWVTPLVLENIRDSWTVKKTLDELRSGPVDSTYFRYRQLQLANPPNVFLLMVESYGKVAATHPLLQNAYAKLTRQWEDSLRQSGWYCSSAFSRAPISGGISWLSIATVLHGTLIKDQALYSYLLNNGVGLPNMVDFFNRMNYTTFNLQPMNRKRPGYSLDRYNRFYPFKKPIYFDDLDFVGSNFGFGFIPDQYTLNYAHSKFWSQIPPPYFVFGITTSSHYPWNHVPEFREDWMSLRIQETEAPDSASLQKKLEKTIHIRVRGREHYAAYFKAMEYELKILFSYILRRAPEHSVFIIVGDHQPPIITNIKQDFDTPLHIISRDSLLYRQTLRLGLQAGLNPGGNSASKFTHQGIYSLLVSLLAEGYSDQPSQIGFKPEGVPGTFLKTALGE